SIAGVLVGFYGAYSTYPKLATWLNGFVSSPAYRYIIAFFAAFVSIYLIIGFLGVVLRHLFKAAALGWADRVLGGTFAMVKAVLIVSVLLVGLTAFLPKNASVMTHSRIAPLISGASEKLAAAVPPELKNKFNNNIKALKETWKKL
ncbi:MAG: CvpA family protein, partial [Deltaproteobacteria bacterium]|nr:CvpA family protein [Deltaproteobacteria bacterium]